MSNSMKQYLIFRYPFILYLQAPFLKLLNVILRKRYTPYYQNIKMGIKRYSYVKSLVIFCCSYGRYTPSKICFLELFKNCKLDWNCNQSWNQPHCLTDEDCPIPESWWGTHCWDGEVLAGRFPVRDSEVLPGFQHKEVGNGNLTHHLLRILWLEDPPVNTHRVSVIGRCVGARYSHTALHLLSISTQGSCNRSTFYDCWGNFFHF